MANLGEEICGEYLQHIMTCEFLAYNVINPDAQGEIDVIGIKLEKKIVYVCEVAVHTSGLQYVTAKRPDDYNRFKAKLDKDIQYAQKYFDGYTIIPMIWSPVVKISGIKAKYNTLKELERVKTYIKEKYMLELQLIINDSFKEAIDELKNHADTKTSEFKSSVMRMFQIERRLEKHLATINKNSRPK
jgi:hypothetical protein